ncbi:uncharacterized protein LOC135388431 [Ornithodoros turicata]|uniref:uncharacterized protein LOC135388431 n=1 Tax=Ornithodoros turicata TaxID=34597 RepID=UPI003138BF37
MPSCVLLLAFICFGVQLVFSHENEALLEEISTECMTNASQKTSLSMLDRNNTMQVIVGAQIEMSKSGKKPSLKTVAEYRKKLWEKIEGDSSITNKEQAKTFAQDFESCAMQAFVRTAAKACRSEVDAANAGVLSEDEMKQLKKIGMAAWDDARQGKEIDDKEMEKRMSAVFKNEKLEAAKRVSKACEHCLVKFMEKVDTPKE